MCMDHCIKYLVILLTAVVFSSCQKGGEPVPYIQSSDGTELIEGDPENMVVIDLVEDIDEGILGDIGEDAPENGCNDPESGCDDGDDGGVIGGGSGNGSGGGVIGGGSGNGSGSGVIGGGSGNGSGGGVIGGGSGNGSGGESKK